MLARRRFHSLLLAGSLGLLTTSATAQAPTSVKAEVMVLHATQQPGAGSIDPQIGNLPQLKRPPFSAYNTYKLVTRKDLTLEKGKPQTETLVNGRVLQVTWNELTQDKRYKIAAHINQPNGKEFLRLLEVNAAANETFFVAGQSYQGGILVIGITIKP